MDKGRFITLEGGEGAGKSTQIKLLGQYLRGRGLDVVTTREVGGCPTAEKIRELWLSPNSPKEGIEPWDQLTEVLLISAARREHLSKTIWPSLEKGMWVLSDRFFDSTRAYQGIALQMGLPMVDHFYHHIAGDFLPDCTLLLDLPVEIGLARMTKRGGDDDRFQQKNVAFHQTLREAFLDLALKYPERIKMIDARYDTKKVSAAIQQAVDKHFGWAT